MDNELKVCIVDDEQINVYILEELVSEQNMDSFTFLHPLKALEHIRESEPDIILVDYMMPAVDGIEFTKKVKEIYPEIVIVMITAVGDDKNLKLEALKAGVSDFLTKPIDVVEVQLRLKNIAELCKSKNIMKKYNETLEKDIQRATKEIMEGYHETLHIISTAAEYKDPETSNHIQRVAHYSKLIAAKAGLDEKEQEIIFYASPLHDIGKISTPDAILLKPGKLTDDEFVVMKTHSQKGADILSSAKNPYLKAGAVISLTHHEKYNGRGYPNGLVGEEIPLYGRITAVADVFDALTSSRPYKKAWSFEDALELIKREKGEHFDPNIVDIFVENIDQVRDIFNRFND